MQSNPQELISALSIFTEMLQGIDHRFYYTCIKDTKTSWNCVRGKQYHHTDPTTKFEHICIFSAKKGNTTQETIKNMDVQFEYRFPNHKVVATLDKTTK